MAANVSLQVAILDTFFRGKWTGDKSQERSILNRIW